MKRIVLCLGLLLMLLPWNLEAGGDYYSVGDTPLYFTIEGANKAIIYNPMVITSVVVTYSSSNQILSVHLIEGTNTSYFASQLIDSGNWIGTAENLLAQTQALLALDQAKFQHLQTNGTLVEIPTAATSAKFFVGGMPSIAVDAILSAMKLLKLNGMKHNGKKGLSFRSKTLVEKIYKKIWGYQTTIANIKTEFRQGRAKEGTKMMLDIVLQEFEKEVLIDTNSERLALSAIKKVADETPLSTRGTLTLGAKTFIVWIEESTPVGTVLRTVGVIGDFFNTVGTTAAYTNPNNIEGTIVTLPIAATDTPDKSLATPFIDVSNNTEWFFPYVSYLKEERVIGGDGNPHFSPWKEITRAAFLEMALKAKLGPDFLSPINGDPFPDVPASRAYARYVDYAKTNGIVQGNNNGASFDPELSINRAEAFKLLRIILSLTLKGSPKIWPDVPSGAWYLSDLNIVTSNIGKLGKWGHSGHLVTGYKNGKIGPADNITRAQAAKIIALAMNIIN